jgi:sirohydrochlorin ferrochelatase
MLKKTDAVLLLGHGSRREEANAPLADVARLVAERLGGVEVSCAFLQFASPGLAEAVEELIARGRRKIAVMPFFLFSGAHVTEDIPEALKNLGEKHPGVELTMCDPLGVHPLLADIVCERIREKTNE